MQRATVPAHHRTAAAAVHVYIQQRPRPGASVTQDPGGHPPHLPRRGTRQGFAELLAAACMRFACTRVRERVCAALTWARVRARGACVGASPLIASTQPHRIPRRRHAHSAHQPCGLGALDAGCKVPGPRRLRSRSASSRGPAEARSPVSAADPARARRRRGLPRKKRAKITNTSSGQKKEGLRGEKSGAAETEKNG